MGNLSIIKPMADLIFMSKMHKMPPDDTWKPFQGDDAKTYVRGVGLAAYSAEMSSWCEAPTPVPPTMYFTPQDPHKYHTDTCRDVGDGYQTLIYAMCDALQYAFNIWKTTLTFSNLKVNAVVAVGSKGCLKDNAPMPFDKLVMTFPGYGQLMTKEKFPKWRDAVGKGVAKCLKDWVDGITMPGLPLYPAFAAFPGPMAPPMPSIPMPLIMCPSTGMNKVTTPDELKKAMLNELDSKIKQDTADKVHETVMESIATAFSLAFVIWMASTQIMNIMGTGQIPTFAPPFVPVGPVVNGQNLPIPGHLAI